MPVELELLLALVLTVQIELGVLVLLRERKANVLGLSVIINVLTNMSLNLWLSLYDASFLDVLVAEVVIILIETLAYRCVVSSLRQAFIYSVLCNAISFLTGVLLELLGTMLFPQVLFNVI